VRRLDLPVAGLPRLPEAVDSILSTHGAPRRPPLAQPTEGTSAPSCTQHTSILISEGIFTFLFFRTDGLGRLRRPIRGSAVAYASEGHQRASHTPYSTSASRRRRR
jgi:hypothetical protein